MQLTAIILLATCLSVSAKPFAQRVTLSEKNAPLEKVFKEMKKQTGFSFFYNEALMAKANKVTIEVRDAQLQAALDLCFKSQPLTYSIVGTTVVVEEKNATAIDNNDNKEPAPPVEIRGRVVDSAGNPLPGAAVKIVQLNKGTFADADGNFVLRNIVPGTYTLEISFTGYSSIRQNITVGETTIDIAAIILAIDIKDLGSQVVISTGYQKISKERFVGSYAQLDSQAFHRRVGMSIIDRLDGTVPGVLFDRKAFNFGIQVRGINTLGILNTSTSPLIVIDNFVVEDGRDLINLNPNDVESVTVLKDAAALSIWGARGGNGVIVVTTKRGKYNQRFHLSVSSNVTVEEKPDLYYVPQISTSDYIDHERYLYGKGAFTATLNNISRPVVSPVVEILERQRLGLISGADATLQIDALRNKDVRSDLDNFVYREAVRQQHYIGFGGGTNLLKYQFSVGYNRSLNNIQGSKPDDVYTIATNTSFRPVKNLEISTGINYALGKQKSTSLNPQSIGLYPYVSLVDSLGRPAAIPFTYRQGYIDTVGGGKLFDWHYRPLDEVRFADIDNTTRNIRLNFGINYKFTNWLRADLRYQLSNIVSNSRNYMSMATFETRGLINAFTNFSQADPNLRYPVPIGGILDLNNNSARSENFRGSLQFDKSWSGLHQLTMLAGGEVSDTKGGFSESSRIYGYDNAKGTQRNTMDFNTQYPMFYAVAPGSRSFIPSKISYKEGDIFRIVSVYANAAYTYKNRYNFYASARRDGANVFGVETNNKWKPIWSIGAAWELSKERFYHLDWLPYAKLRISHGYTGNVNNTLPGVFVLSNLQFVDQLSSLPYSIPGRAPNANLKWESNKIENFGFDFRLFKSQRLSGSIEVFFKHASDVISEAPMPPSSGVNRFALNYATLKTKGYEINLNSVNLNIGSFQWTTDFSLSHSKTIITKFFGGNAYKRASQFTSYGLNATEGEMPFVISGYRWAGLDPLNGDPQGYLNGQVSKDYTGIGNDTSRNQVVFGSALPLYSGFIRNNFSWKGLTLSFNITGRFNYYYREPSINLDAITVGSARAFYTTDFYNRWQQPGDEAHTSIPSITYPSSSIQGRNSFYQFAEIHVKRADNIRLQDVRLSYQWNNNGKALPFQSIQFYFYPNNLNLILWSYADLKYDPDFTGGGDATSIVKPPKTWTGGITINF